MIPATPGPKWAASSRDENRFAQWLEVELAASEALAETGEVPAEAADALRAHASFDVARIHEIEREVKHDVIAFTTAVAEKMAAAGARRSFALAALRPDLERHRRYRAGVGVAASLGVARRRIAKPCSSSLQPPRLRVQAHRADRPHPRHPRRADHLRPEDRSVVRRDCRANIAASRTPLPKTCASAKSPAPSAPSATSVRKPKKKSARAWA